MNDPVHAVFVTADGESCAEAVEALEAAGDDDLRIGGATSVEAVRAAMEEVPVDAVVFGEDEDPLSPEGVQLLDVVDLCTAPPGDAERSAVPLVLFSDGTYPLSTARATDGVADYVRADGPDAYGHLADRLRWLAGETGDDAAYYKRIVEEMEDGVLTFDDAGRIRYANGAMADAFGLDQDVFEGIDPADLADRGLVSEDGVAALVGAVEAIVSGGAELQRREMTISPSAEDVDRRVVEFQLVGMPGEASGVIATVRGVTEYKRMENALRTTRTKVERLPEGVRAIRSADTEAELFETTATAVSEFLGADVCGVEVVEDGQFVPRATVGADYGPSSATEGADARAVEAGESVLVESPSGDDAPVENAGSQLCLPVEGLGLVRAMSGGRLSDRDRGLAEALAEHAAETLARIRAVDRGEEFRDRLTSLYDNVPHPVASVELDGGQPVVVAVNDAFERTFGLAKAEANGQRLWAHVRPPADDDSTVDGGELETALRAGRHVETTVRRRTTDGPRTFELHVGPSAAAGEDGYLVYVDVTDERERERIRRRQSERLDRIGELATDDLRDSLNEARGYLELAAETRDPEDVAAVEAAHERLGRLVEDVTTLASQDPELDRRPIDIETVAVRAWRRVDPAGAEFAVEEGSVEADADHLSGLFEQLFRNAVEHASTSDRNAPRSGDAVDHGAAGNGDGSSLAVRVGPLADDPGFFVEDTTTRVPPALRGDGMDDGTDPADEGESRLAAVQQTAREHGWSVRVRETDRGGARFEFVVD